MGLRLTTAITLIAAAGLVAACNEEDDTTVAAGDPNTTIIEDGQTAETASAEVSSDVAVPSEGARVEGATGGELEAAMSDSTASPAVEGAADESANTELTSAQPAENQPMSSEAEIPADEAASADDAVAENDAAVEAAAAETTAPEAATGDATETASADATAAGSDAEQPADDAAEIADAGATDDAAAVTDDATATETASADGTETGAVEPLTDDELASLNLEDLDLEGGDGVERLTAYVEDSDAFDATEKSVLVAGIEAAQDDPEQMQVIFDQIKEIALNAN